VASGTSGWEANRNMRGTVCSSEVRLVAGVTVGRQCCVVVVGVALSASNGCVCAGEREHGSMVEGGRSPVGGGMA